MTLEMVRDMLGWCTLINWGILILWWMFFALAHNRVYALHTRTFNVSPERFDELHYQAMAIFKMGIIVFNLTPYLALRIVG